MQTAEPPLGPDRQIRVPCMCIGSCQILVVAEWEWEEDAKHTTLSFFTTYRHDSWRERFRNAWRSLFPKSSDPYYHDILITQEQAESLGRFLAGGDS